MSMTPKSSEVADQVRELGLQLGDMIEGHEGDHRARLVLRYIGAEVAVFDEWVHVDDGTWRYLGESAEWDLSCRDWISLGRTAQPIQLAAQIDTLLTHPDWIARLRDLLADLPATEAQRRALQCIRDEDMTRWDDECDRAVVAALEIAAHCAQHAGAQPVTVPAIPTTRQGDPA
jgi:hypothetical protein